MSEKTRAMKAKKKAPKKMMWDDYAEAKPKSDAVKGYYKGGSVDGCVKKGRTKGKMV